MPSVLIRNMDEVLHRRLKASAASHHRSLEEEARELLRAAVARQDLQPDESIADIVEQLFGNETDDFDLEIPPRGRTSRRSPPFSEEL